MATIEAGGLSVEHHLTGSGAPVVLLHGLFAASSASWYFTCAPGLSEHFRLLLYDLRGHGRTQRAKSGYDTATLQADLGALLDALSWNEPVSLVGHSYGGLIALAFALRHPDRVARLALVDAPLPPSTLPHLEEFFSRGPGGMAEALPPPMRAFLERGSRQSTRLLKNLSALAFETDILAALRAEPELPDSELARLRSPLLIYGQDSPCRADGERLARVVPGAKWALLPGGHQLLLEQAAHVTRLIIDDWSPPPFHVPQSTPWCAPNRALP